jgi:C4-dicarboxylate-specific signal transduction histidine kinase
VWSTRDAAASLRLPRPLVRRPWFLLLCGATLAGLVLLGGRLLARRHRARVQRLERLVEQRTADLQREIGERLRAQEALLRSHDELEDRVRERTAQLVAELAERSRLEQELLQSRKLEAVGRLAGGVAHDMNNMLTAIIGCAEFACDAATDERQREDIEGIRATAERART